MKIIISHDIDHITVFEHKKDLIIPKFIIRSFIEFGLGYISFSELGLRFRDILKNKWNNIEELMTFNIENNVPATFFIGVNNGRCLSYSLEDSKFWINKIKEKGFKIGVHGIAYDNLDSIKTEFEIFKQISGLDKFGIRMHYLMKNDETVELLSKTGYIYDSSIYGINNPIKIGDLWEFPLCIMDGYLVYKNSRYQNQTLEQIKDATKITLEEAYNKGINYFTILFHDRYFSDSFKTWKNWYIWLIEYLKKNNFEFIDFENAVNELNIE
jgi:peptidoglycan/xylan/chitin deacetylase (PgdA/CDA1 family)